MAPSNTARQSAARKPFVFDAHSLARSALRSLVSGAVVFASLSVNSIRESFGELAKGRVTESERFDSEAPCALEYCRTGGMIFSPRHASPMWDNWMMIRVRQRPLESTTSCSRPPRLWWPRHRLCVSGQTSRSTPSFAATQLAHE